MAPGEDRGYKNRTRSRTRPRVPYRGRAVSKRHRSEVECVQSLIMRPRKKKLHWKLALCDCVHAFLSALCVSLLHMDPLALYIVSRYCWRTYIFVLATDKSSPFPLTSHYRTRGRIRVMLDRESSTAASTTIGSAGTEKRRRYWAASTWLELISSLRRAVRSHASTGSEWLCYLLRRESLLNVLWDDTGADSLFLRANAGNGRMFGSCGTVTCLEQCRFIFAFLDRLRIM